MHPSLLTDIVTTLRAMESPEAGEWLALTRTPDALTREGAPGHFTASALPISPDASQVCLVLHRRMDLWVQPGGHLEFGDTSIAGAAAREMEEETGLQGRVDPRPVLLSRHPAPCRPETWHYDIQFRAVVPVTRPVLHVHVASGTVPSVFTAYSFSKVYTTTDWSKLTLPVWASAWSTDQNAPGVLMEVDLTTRAVKRVLTFRDVELYPNIAAWAP